MTRERLPLFLRAINAVAMVCALVAGAAVAILALLILIDIIGRSFGYSLQGTDEFGGYVLALCGSLGLSWALINRGHPRIDLGFRFFPPKLQSLLHIAAHATICGLALFMTIHAVSELRTTLRFGAITNTPLQTPLWLPQSLWVFGLGLFTLCALSATLHGAWLWRHSPGEVSRHYGPPTVEDEISEYIAPSAEPTKDF